MNVNILRINTLCKKLGVCRASVYRFLDLEDFPKPIALGARSVGWLEDEVNLWISNRVIRRETKGQKNG